jgi:hypothetical protein
VRPARLVNLPIDGENRFGGMGDRRQNRTTAVYICIANVVLAMAAILRLLGRVWWCKFGDYRVYVNEAWNSSHTSQHLFDPYTFTHILHGVALLWLFAMILREAPSTLRYLAAITSEAAWEILENTDYIIQKYRENTASLDYFGDSIANSVGDVAACALGVWIAARIGCRWSIAFFLGIEVLLLVWIRDSLLLNVLMLIYPVEWIKNWQAAL